jgi:hypothetical protein
MDLGDRTIWQQAAGDGERNYHELCLRFDVILNGPGRAGNWPFGVVGQPDISERKVRDIRRFAEEMKEGDLVVLREGTATVRGVGEVVGTYQWLDAFGDVDGWELQHVRRVRWLWLGEKEAKEFTTYALKMGDTTQTLNEGPVQEWLASLNVPGAAWQRPLTQLPGPADKFETTMSSISNFLFDRGVASASVGHLLAEIGELTRIANWYQRAGKPSEHETVAYLVVPLLRALGWTPQRMAVEWNRVDVALFDRLPREDSRLRVVVEAKRMDNACLSALSQAEAYAKDKPACTRLIVTDGMRYGVYLRDPQGGFLLHAYLNLVRLRSRYPIYDCGGAEDALLAMAPEWDSGGRPGV